MRVHELKSLKIPTSNQNLNKNLTDRPAEKEGCEENRGIHEQPFDSAFARIRVASAAESCRKPRRFVLQ